MPRYELCDCSFPPTNPARVCAFCGELTMGQPEGRCLSNSDVDSDVVSVSNLRVWAREHSDTEGSLWHMRHGHYGSQWVEVRPELIDLTPRDPLYKRAESLGLTGLTRIVDDLNALAPVAHWGGSSRRGVVGVFGVPVGRAVDATSAPLDPALQRP